MKKILFVCLVLMFASCATQNSIEVKFVPFKGYGIDSLEKVNLSPETISFMNEYSN